MAVTIDATVSGASSNSYCTLAEAETYHENKLFSTVWHAATEQDKNAALVWAARLLDELIQWTGTIASTTQAMRWPRSGAVNQDDLSIADSVVPDFLKDAQAEFAQWLITSDRTKEDKAKGYKEIGIGRGEVKLVIDKYNRAGIIPDVVWQMIMYYGVKKKQIARRLVRV